MSTHNKQDETLPTNSSGEGLIMSMLLQERPATSNPKQRHSRRGTSDKAFGQRDAPSQRQTSSRKATSPASRSQPPQTKSGTPPASQPARKHSSVGVFFDSFNLVKCFTLFGFTVAATHVIIFGLDLAIAWPLQRASVLFDVNCIICGLLLACLSLGTFKDQVREAR